MTGWSSIRSRQPSNGDAAIGTVAGTSDALDLDRVRALQVLVGEQDDAVGDLAVAGLELPKELDVLARLVESAGSEPRTGAASSG